jgi:putative phosphoesterase
MRVALISDIHGNRVSLDAVLADMEREPIDEVICLGDVATLGPQPRETVTRLQDLDCHFIMGNHETDVLDITGMEQRQEAAPIVIEAVKWCADQLSDEQLNFLRSFRPTLELQLDVETTLLCFHGSSKSNTDIILATTPPDELDALLVGSTATILAGGHTHIPMLRRHHGQVMVNPGSVGEPLVQMPIRGLPYIFPWAEYAILSAEQGAVNVEFRRVPVDLHAIKQASASSTNPLNWADLWLSPDGL